MTIRKGEPWGERGPLAPEAPVVADDRAVSRVLDRGGPEADRLTEVGLTGGDLHRTLGSPRHGEEQLRSGEGRRLPVDVGRVRLADGSVHHFIAHLIAHDRRHRRWWTGRTVIVMNGDVAGHLRLGPRAHPNDGRLDLTDGRLPSGQRRLGRQRARSATHVPHPALSVRRVRHVDVDHDRPLYVWVDGERVGRSSSLEVECLADRLTVVV